MTLFSSLYGARLDRELGTDDTSILFTTARRKAAVNEGAVEFANLTGILTRWASVTWPGGTAQINLNSTAIIADGDFGGFAKEPVEFRYTDASSNVTLLTGDGLPRRDIPWLDQYRPGWQLSTVASSVMQLPEIYYVWQDGNAYYLGMTPVPSTGSSASIAVRVPYLAEAPTMVSDSSEPFQFGSTSLTPRADLSAYHQGLVHYAAHQLEKLRRDEQASDRQLQKFLGYVSRCLQDMRVRGPRVIRQARNYFASRTA